MEGVQAASTRLGHFCTLPNFCISAGGAIMRDHLQSAARNATYSSSDIQNQLISILGDIICNAIKGGCYQKPPKFEHIFGAVITFPPFFCANTFDSSLLLTVCALRWCVKSIYRHLFLEDISKHARVTQEMALPNLWQI